MNGKQYVAATLFASVLLTLVFTPIAHQQSNGTYDPWLDHNGDGIIDVKDLHPLAQSYGTEGDPARNITIAKHASKVVKPAEWEPIEPGFTWTAGIPSDGYSKVTVLISFGAKINTYRLLACDEIASKSYLVDSCANFSNYFVKTYDVMHQVIVINIWNGEGMQTLNVDVYLTA